jgi:N-acetylmuramoyl-L-alanine amidase
VPVVLVEMCVLTNPGDEDKVSSSKGLDRLAASLADACVKSLMNDY